jgi:transposase-like protein
MACTKEELQERIRTTPVVNGKVRYSPELRRDLIEYSRVELAHKRSLNSIGNELGMNSWTLARWHQNERRAGGTAFVEVSTKGAPRLRPSGATAAVTAQPFEVTCPSGFGVRVPASFEPRALRELLSALEGR